MLAKIWKKFLLAVCIIACIYNIMSKLVNRASLEANLQKANDGNTIFDFSSKSSDDDSEIVEGIVTKNTVVQDADENSVASSSTVNETIIENTIVSEEQSVNEEQEENENSSAIVKFTDFIFKW